MATVDGLEIVDGGKLYEEKCYTEQERKDFLSFLLANFSIFDALRNSDRKTPISVFKRNKKLDFSELVNND